MNSIEIDKLRARLKVSTDPKTYYCQASELFKSTQTLSRLARVGRYVYGLFIGNFNSQQMAQDLATWSFWSIHRTLFGEYPRGVNQSTPEENMNLQPGEWVEVKSEQEIIQTLDKHGQNRGLHFSPDMRRSCGKRYRVNRRLDKIIMDGTGRMARLRNTVALEGAECGCSYMGFGMGACARCDVAYWREIWLRRSEGDPVVQETTALFDLARDQVAPVRQKEVASIKCGDDCLARG